jgi:photosystem II stability/assembly factor-like uncharacterized protein
MKYLFPILIVFSYISSAQIKQITPIQNISGASFRGVSIVDDNVSWVSGSKGWIGRSSNKLEEMEFFQVNGYEDLDFRTIYAFNEKTAIIANAGSPARIFRTSNGGKSWEIVYENNNKDAFIDGVDFWNDMEGMIYGDPINGKMFLLFTDDGGKSWMELPENNKPFLKDGEASFAASGTNIRCYGKKRIIIATGGSISRLFISNDKGRSWKVKEVPILQGKSSTGIFSVAFRSNHGIVVGGDYTQDMLTEKHVLYSSNAGKSWHLPIRPTGGYRSCVEYINDNILIATGTSGTDISYNKGKEWQIFIEEGFHVVKKARKGNRILIAGSEGRINIIDFAE